MKKPVISHEPADYACPFCAFLNGKQSDYNNDQDIVVQNHAAVAFMCPMTWPKNHGNIIVVPKVHIENIYMLPDEQITALFKLVRNVSAAIRERYDDCSGVSIIQRNEPNDGQQVWHLHVHVVPRYAGDEFSEQDQTEFASAEVRAPFARKLREYLLNTA
jgi:histidine triad (HIT) family protein